MANETSIHAFTFPSIDGTTIDFADFKGKKLLIVNTASDCEYTPQFNQLEELFRAFNNSLMIVGFPSNNFGGQEPGENKEIKNFCKYKYGVTFPLASKSDVIGDSANPIFKWLTEQKLPSGKNKIITWNFQKFLLNEAGELIEVFSPATEPINDEMLKLLREPQNVF